TRFPIVPDHDEIHRDLLSALVQQLVKGVLARRAGRAPDDRRRGVVGLVPVAVHALAVRFHLELLKVGRQIAQILAVGDHGAGLVDLPGAASSQARARAALSRVSTVVNVFDATMKKVVAGVRPVSAASRSAGSMLETKCILRPGFANLRIARTSIRGPRSEPPMPMLTMSVMARPSTPLSTPPCTSPTKRRM